MKGGEAPFLPPCDGRDPSEVPCDEGDGKKQIKGGAKKSKKSKKVN